MEKKTFSLLWTLLPGAAGVLLALAAGPESWSKARPLAAAGRILLIGCGILLAFSAAWTLTAEWLAASESVVQANTAQPRAAGFTNAVQGILALLRLIPSLLGAMALVWAGQLVFQVSLDPFGETSLSLCGRTARACRHGAAESDSKPVAAAALLLSVQRQLPYRAGPAAPGDDGGAVPAVPLVPAGPNPEVG